MKNKYPIQVIDLRHQDDHITTKKIQLFEEFNTDPANVNAWIFTILIRHRQIGRTSDGIKIIEVKVIKTKKLNFRGFMRKYNQKMILWTNLNYR